MKVDRIVSFQDCEINGVTLNEHKVYFDDGSDLLIQRDSWKAIEKWIHKNTKPKKEYEESYHLKRAADELAELKDLLKANTYATLATIPTLDKDLKFDYRHIALALTNK